MTPAAGLRKCSGGESEPRTTKEGNQWHFGMTAHIGVDADSCLVHTIVGTAANAHDVTQTAVLFHGQKTDFFAVSDDRGVHKREEVVQTHPDVACHVATRSLKRQALDKNTPLGAMLEKLEQIKASICSKVEHPFGFIQCRFGHRQTRYRALAKNTHSLQVMFALSSLWMVRKHMLCTQALG